MDHPCSRSMDEYAGKGVTLRIREPMTLTCQVQELKVQGEISRHALLIPVGVHLDLNGSTLNLDLRQNSHGVRLSNRSGIRNGTIRIVRSENKGSQAAWHSGVSVGAPYDDGGTPEAPGYFSKVSDWTIEDITIDQPFPAAAIQLMSEACHGVIRRVRILDSPQALLGVGMDWGSRGKGQYARMTRFPECANGGSETSSIPRIPMTYLSKTSTSGTSRGTWMAMMRACVAPPATTSASEMCM